MTLEEFNQRIQDTRDAVRREFARELLALSDYQPGLEPTGEEQNGNVFDWLKVVAGDTPEDPKPRTLVYFDTKAAKTEHAVMAVEQLAGLSGAFGTVVNTGGFLLCQHPGCNDQARRVVENSAGVPHRVCLEHVERSRADICLVCGCKNGHSKGCENA